VLQVLQAVRVEQPERLVEGPFLRLWPHRHRSDGFFAAVWQRR
jgi:16S rRNA (cytosine967-C5)-methyltransferase